MSILARATACNTFLIAKLLYVFRILHCSSINVQALFSVRQIYLEIYSGADEAGQPFALLGFWWAGFGQLFSKQVVSRFFLIRDPRGPFFHAAAPTSFANFFRRLSYQQIMFK